VLSASESRAHLPAIAHSPHVIPGQSSIRFDCSRRTTRTAHQSLHPRTHGMSASSQIPCPLFWRRIIAKECRKSLDRSTNPRVS
jgi:hypothetical protein